MLAAQGYFDVWRLNDLLAIQAVERAQSGFTFLREVLKNPVLGPLATTIPCCRQVDILVSHNFELLLNAAVFCGADKSFATQSELIDLVRVNHRLDVLLLKISHETRAIVGITAIARRTQDIFIHYDVTFIDGEKYTIHDLKNIRYDFNDFRGKEATQLRLNDTEKFPYSEFLSKLDGINSALRKIIYNNYVIT